MAHTRSYLPRSPPASPLRTLALGVCVLPGLLGTHAVAHTDLGLVEPWGRILPMKKDVEAGSKPESEGGTGTAEKFWDWADQQVKQYE